MQFPWQQESWNWIINWIWLLLLLVYMFYGQRLQVSIWVRQIKRALQKLEYMVRKGKEITIKGSQGVGVVTKPGLAIPVGDSAINPVPRKMIIKELMKL